MILDFGAGFFLHRATAADHAALATVRLKNGDAGKDRSRDLASRRKLQAEASPDVPRRRGNKA
ncbi:MAG: hypothetical protein E5W94_20145 [Mesorhizobium sp.]|nr:MAG: hypothetical protein E5W94_20145 [Mesorhizobium sp.]